MQTAEKSSEHGHHASVDVSALNQLAALGLVQMFDAEKQLFCFRLKLTPDGLVKEGISHRYTIMSLLGLHRLEAARQQFSPIGVKAALDGLLGRADWVSNIGDLGLLLWACALVSPERLEEICAELDVKSALATFPESRLGRTMELAWFLTGVAHAIAAGGKNLSNLEGPALKTFELLVNNQGEHGFFGHIARRGTLAGIVRGRIGSFADQVYPIYALTRFAHAFQNRTALERATNCADAICRTQGSLGQWWWHYDALSGRVFQRYPIYSVHQEGMAPMALFALGEAAGIDFTESIYKGLAWISGKNELNRDLRDVSSSLVWRDIYRNNTLKMYLSEFAEFFRSDRSAVALDELAVNCECRPYELGWLLYAFAGRDTVLRDDDNP